MRAKYQQHLRKAAQQVDAPVSAPPPQSAVPASAPINVPAGVPASMAGGVPASMAGGVPANMPAGAAGNG